MNSNSAATAEKIREFRRLHESGCFVIPNPWDAGTAIYLERLGFKALATTSAGLAFSLGSAGEIGDISLENTLGNIQEIVAASALPVNADFQEGFADEPDEVAHNVGLCVDTGVAGLSIEDRSGSEINPIYERGLAIERVKAASGAIKSTGKSVLLTGRCEARLLDGEAPLAMIIDRLIDYAEAGADCLFAPGVTDADEVGSIVAAVQPKSVNVLMSGAAPDMTVSKLADLGVRRISVGSALARTAWGAFTRASRKIFESGSFSDLSSAASFDELSDVFNRND